LVIEGGSQVGGSSRLNLLLAKIDAVENVRQEVPRGEGDSSVAVWHQATKDPLVEDLRCLYDALIEFKQVTEHPRASAGAWPAREEPGLQLDRLRLRRGLWAGRAENPTGAAPGRMESGRLRAPIGQMKLAYSPLAGPGPCDPALRPFWSPESFDARHCVGHRGWNE